MTSLMSKCGMITMRLTVNYKDTFFLNIRLTRALRGIISILVVSSSSRENIKLQLFENHATFNRFDVTYSVVKTY